MRIRVQMPAGTGSVSVAGQSYTANDDGVVVVDSPHHVAPLVGMGGTELGEDDKPGTTSQLVGSAQYPESVMLREGQDPTPIADIIAKTVSKMGLSVDEWNNLPAKARDAFIGFYIGTENGTIGDVSATKHALDDARADVDRLKGELEDAQTQISHLQRDAAHHQTAPAPGADGSTVTDPPVNNDPPAERPDFQGMTKAVINDWLTSNSGNPAEGNHAAHVDAANAHWLVLHPAA